MFLTAKYNGYNYFNSSKVEDYRRLAMVESRVLLYLNLDTQAKANRYAQFFDNPESQKGSRITCLAKTACKSRKTYGLGNQGMQHLFLPSEGIIIHFGAGFSIHLSIH